MKKILEKNLKWLNGEAGGERANLSGANLFGAHLSRADLSRADLSGADLSKANLIGANLTEANLSGADLIGANLSGANLTEANLSRAHLYRANLSGAKGIITFQGPKHFAFATPTLIKIGCKSLNPKDFLEQYKEIGIEEGYSKEEIEAYGAFIKLAIKLFEANE